VEPQDRASGWGAPERDIALAEFAPTAQRILDAARRVLERDGYSGLTLRRIGREAGETKSLIVYHFGDKDGLIAALVDSLWHEEDMDLVRRLGDLPDAPADRLRALIDVHHALALETPDYRVYFDLLPNLMRDASARRRHAQLNASYRAMGVMATAGTALDDDERQALACLLLAVGEGAGALVLLDPEGFDHDAAFALLQTLTAQRAAVVPAGAIDSAPADAGASRMGAAGATAEGGAAPVDIGSGLAGGLPPVMADPTAELAPVARRLLEGAIKVLVRDGLERLTFEAVADASGEPRSATTYYFGEKHNLIVAAHDTLLYRAQQRTARRLRAAQSAPRSPLAGAPSRIPGGPRAFRPLYELLPAVLRDDHLRRRHEEYLAWLRAALTVAAVERGEPSSPALVDLTLAVTYGLPIQLLQGSRSIAARPVLEMWESLVAGFDA